MPRVKDLKIERFSGLRSSKPLSPRRKRFDFTAGLALDGPTWQDAAEKAQWMGEETSSVDSKLTTVHMESERPSFVEKFLETGHSHLWMPMSAPIYELPRRIWAQWSTWNR